MSAIQNRLCRTRLRSHNAVAFSSYYTALCSQASGEAETDVPGDEPERVFPHSHFQRGEVVRERSEEEKASSVREKMEVWRRGLREKYSDLPGEYRGYEALLDGEREGVVTYPIPKGTQK